MKESEESDAGLDFFFALFKATAQLVSYNGVSDSRVLLTAVDYQVYFFNIISRRI